MAMPCNSGEAEDPLRSVSSAPVASLRMTMVQPRKSCDWIAARKARSLPLVSRWTCLSVMAALSPGEKVPMRRRQGVVASVRKTAPQP